MQSPAEANVGPDGQITALAIGFGHLVPADTITIHRRVETAAGGLTYEFPVAGLASWLCLKSDAIMRRNKPKDAYDVVWTLDALGPDIAGDQVASSPLLGGEFAEELVAQLHHLVADQFRDIDSVGPTEYAVFLEAEAGELEQRHARDVMSFGRALAARGVV